MTGYRRGIQALLLGTILWLATPVAANGPCEREGPVCELDIGSYRVELPGTPPGPGGYPALIFFHGAGGSGARTLGNRAMVEAFTARGYAVVAPDGLKRPGSRFGPGWSFHPDRPKQRDEAAFTRALIGDAAARHGIDPGRVLLSGFSIGGSLVWYLACEDPALADAYAPVAGAFWRPHPKWPIAPARSGCCIPMAGATRPCP